jgi:hypothetical protein
VGVDKDRNAKPAVDLEALCRHVRAALRWSDMQEDDADIVACGHGYSSMRTHPGAPGHVYSACGHISSSMRPE